MTSEANQPRPSDNPGVRRFIFPAIFVAALFVALWMRSGDEASSSSSTSSSSSSAEWTLRGEAFGTSWMVRGADPLEGADALKRKLDASLEAVDASMSTWRKDSELSKLNAGPRGPVTVSPGLMTVLAAAEDVSVATSGAFDVTVGPLVAAWGFGAGKSDSPPSAEALGALRERVGYQKLTLDRSGRTVERAREDVSADLSAIAKGYAVDQMAEVLQAAGLSNWMVEVGGEMRVSGLGSKGKPWRLGIEKPTPEGRAVAFAIDVGDAALATSGDYRQFRRVDGRVVSHTIDPRTGAPVDHGPASVSVVAPTCMEADAWATALMVLGPKGLPLATERGLAALILERTPDGAIEEHMNPAFESIRVKRPDGSSTAKRQE